jgi:pyruvate dehydrogenase (quinone)
MTVGDFLLQRLRDWGMDRMYGYPGDGINGILGSLNRAGNRPELVHVRHEEMAAFMACAHAKFTGEMGVCLATGGPGAVHVLNGLYDARLDHQPVLAIVGQQPRSAMGSNFQQEIDLQSLFKDVAHSYVQTLNTPEQFPLLIDRAVRIAKSERTVTCIIVPADLQDQPAEVAHPQQHGFVNSGIGYAEPRVVPAEEDLQHAASVINAGERVGMLIGAGAANAAEEVKQVCEILGCGVAKAILGKEVLPDDLPYVTGSIGLLGTEPSSDMMQGCDTLLMVGTSFPYPEFLPPPGQARGVEIDIDSAMIGIRYPTEVNLVGDAKATLRGLIPLLERNQDRSWRNRIESNVAEWWQTLENRAHNEAHPVNPQRVFAELSPRLPDHAIVTSDSGSAANWYARHLKIRADMKASLSGGLATMGSGVPYAIAAKFNFPERVPIACVGDGAMQMNGLNELITIKQYWKRWADPRLVILVLHNQDLNQVTWEMRVMEGDPKFEASQYIPDVPYVEYAEMLGLKGVRVDDPEALAEAWETVLSADRPAVLEAITDPEVPPIPPHVTFEQAKGLGYALLGRDPAASSMVGQVAKGAAAEYLPSNYREQLEDYRRKAEDLLEKARRRGPGGRNKH